LLEGDDVLATARAVEAFGAKVQRTGDGKWRLFDLKSDPGETRDLSAAQPERFAAMLADYRAYAKANGVLDMPAGYSADEQINRYAFEQRGRERLLRLGLWAGGILLVLAALVWGLRRRRNAAAR